MEISKGIPTIPKSRVVSWTSSFKHPKSSHDRVIGEHFFNSSLELMFPFQNEKLSKKLEEKIEELEENHFFYASKDKKLSEIVDLAHDLFSKGCVVYSTSVCSHSDGSNGFVILPTGEIVLSLDKDTYETFGINGTKAKYSEQHRIEVKFSSLSKEKPLYKNLMKGLEKTLPIPLIISVYKGIFHHLRIRRQVC
jgi:hypothetical protein